MYMCVFERESLLLALAVHVISFRAPYMLLIHFVFSFFDPFLYVCVVEKSLCETVCVVIIVVIATICLTLVLKMEKKVTLVSIKGVFWLVNRFFFVSLLFVLIPYHIIGAPFRHYAYGFKGKLATNGCKTVCVEKKREKGNWRK